MENAYFGLEVFFTSLLALATLGIGAITVLVLKALFRGQK